MNTTQDDIACTPSARGVFRIMDMPYSTVWKILRKIIHFYSYKINYLQELRYTDHQKQLTFALAFLAKMEVDGDWPWKILWGDEAHFYLNGFVNTKFAKFGMTNRQMFSKKSRYIHQK